MSRSFLYRGFFLLGLLLPSFADLVLPASVPALVQEGEPARAQSADISLPDTPIPETPIIIASSGEPAFAPLPQIAAAPVAYPSFNNPVLEQQIAHYLQYVAVMGVPDILIVGSSRSRQGIHPSTLERTLAARGYGQVRAFNFSVNGATAQVVNFVLKHLLSTEQLPRLILWGDGLRAFNSGRTDATFQKILTSPGYRYLVSGRRPVLANPPPLRSQPQQPCIESPLASAASDRDGGPVLPFTSNRPFQQTLSTTFRTSRVRWYPNPTLPVCNPRSNWPSLRNRLRQPNALPIPQIPISTGFLEVPTRFNPATYYQQYPRVSGRYDGDYVPFIVEGGLQVISLQSVAALARQQKIPLVVVNMPLSQPHLDRTRVAYEQQFNQKMRRLAHQERFYFRNYLQAWPGRSDYFADPSHLNRYGAQMLAMQLAQDASIPWPRKVPQRRAR